MKQSWRRIFGGLLAVLLVFSNVPVFSLASMEGLCPHHESHDGCGYAEAVTESPCTHKCDEGCYETVTACTHVHGDCGYAEAVEGIPCDHVHGDCGYAEAVEGKPCDHVHGDCGYAQAVEESPCDHVHGDCGYAEAVEEIPCDHVCGEECAEGCVHTCGDGSCSYAEGIPGSACSHNCADGNCAYKASVSGADCSHICTDGTCGYTESTPGAECTHVCGDGSCAWAEGSEGIPCSHECSEDSGCVTKALNCKHAHDETCGYREAVAAGECQYVCQLCEMEVSPAQAQQEENEADPPEVTRAQWIQALVETFSMTVEDDNYPDNYYSDLTGEEEYYRDIMVAVEFGVIDLEAGQPFRPEEAATREFAAQTLNYALGFKLDGEKIYTFEEANTVAYPDDIQISIDRGWFVLEEGYFLPEKPITEEERDSMLEDAAAVLAEEDDSEDGKTEFADWVIEVPESAAVSQTGSNELVIYGDHGQLKEGDVFVVYEYGFPVALKAVSVSGDADAQRVTYTADGTGGAITELHYTGSIPVKLSDFVPAEATTFRMSGYSVNAAASTYSLRDISVNSQGIDINRKLSLIDGMEVSLNSTFSDVTLEMEIDSDRNYYKVLIKSSNETVIDMNVDFIEGFGGAKEVHLGRVRFLYGTCYVDLSANFDLTGEAEVVLNADMSAGFSVSDGNFRLLKSFQKKTFNFISEVNAQAGLITELGLDVLLMRANVWQEFGGKMRVYDITYDSGTPKHCGDLEGHLYMDVGANAEILGFKAYTAEENIWTQDNSPVRMAFHYEDGVRVSQCTRSNEPGYTTDPSSGNYFPSGGNINNTTIKDEYGNEVPLWSYTVESDGYASIYGYNGKASSITIPSVIDGYTVKYINDIGSYNTVSVVTIPEGIVEIRSGAFSGNESLLRVSIPDSVTQIGAQAFSGCVNMSLKRIPQGLKKIGSGAFAGCGSLGDSFTVYDDVEMGSCVFDDCNIKLVVKKKTGTIEHDFIQTICGIRELEIEEGITSIGHNAFTAHNTEDAQNILCKVTIPDSVQTVGGYAFQNCDGLTDFTPFENVMSFGYYAFEDCDGFTEITLSGDSLRVEPYTFYDCDGITSVNIYGECSVGSYAFAECDSLKEATVSYFALDDYTYETGILQHNTGIFHHCDSLESVTVVGERIDPYKVNEFCDIDIDDSVFSDCPKLKDLKLVDVEVNSVGAECFARSGISSITDYGWNLHYIGAGAFRDCANLTEIRIGWRTDDTQERIRSGAFENCRNLKKVTFTAKAAGIAADAFVGCTAKMYYPVDMPLLEMQGDTPWSESNMLNYGGNLSWVAYEPNRTLVLNPPKSMTVPAGEKIVISLDTVGDGLQYYWYINGKFDPTIRGNTYSVTMSEAVHGQSVYCYIHCFYGYFSGTNRITLSMGTPVTIDKQPASTAAFKGEQTSVSVEARGDDLTYTWYRKNQYRTWGEAYFQEDKSQTGSTYTVTAGEGAQNYYGTVYSAEVYCVVTDRNGTSVTSETVTVTTKFKANITGYLSSVGVEPGQTATVTLEAEGDGLTYAWYFTSPTDYEHFTRAETVTGDTYSHTLNGSEDRQLVYCVITDQYGNSVTSNRVMLDIAIPLKILRQPQSVTAPIGSQAVVSVLADGDRLNYTWFYAAPGSESFSIAEGQNQSTLSVTMTEDTNGARVYCMINDRLGRFAATDFVTLSAGQGGVRITKQPEDVFAAAGSNAVVSIQAEGDGLTYSWYYAPNSEEKLAHQPEFRGASFSVRMSEENAGSRVCCMVEDAYGNFVVSDTVNLYLNSELTITKQPESVQVPAGKTAEVSLEVQGEGLTYAWYFKNADATKFSLTKTFTGNIYSCKMDGTRDGRQVYCVVTDAYGNSVISETVTLSMKTPLKILVQPATVTVAEGANAVVSVKAQGDGLTYQWYYADAGQNVYRYTPTFTGSSYTVQMNESRNCRKVYCVITDQYGDTVTSDTVTLVMQLKLQITAQPKSVAVAEGRVAKVSVGAQGVGLTYAWYYKNAEASKFTLTNSFKSNTYSVTMDASRNGRQVYCVITDAYGNTVISDTVTLSMKSALAITDQPKSVEVEAGKVAKVTVTAQGEGLSYKWYFKNAGASKFSLTNSFKSNSYSVTMDASRDGRQIYCVITDAYGNQVQSETVTLSMAAALKITQQPKSVEVAEGANAVVSIRAEGQGLTYKWYFKEANGAKFYLTNSFKGSSYTVQMNAARNGRQVYCVITDAFGNSVTTNTVTLSMKEAKTELKILTHPKSVTVSEGETAKVIVQAVGDGLSYRWYYKNAGASSYTYTSSFKGNTYSVTMNAARNGRRVLCKIYDQYGNMIQSQSALLRMK